MKHVRRVLCLLLCAAVLLPCAVASAETAKVTAYLLRLRAQPSSKAEVIDAFPRGTTVTVLKKGSEWTKVSVRGKTGYMLTGSLSFGKSSSSGNGSSSGKGGSGGTTMYVRRGTWLNLRAAPDSDAEILATIRGGTAVTVLKKGKYWSKVSVKGLVGYMGNDYLTGSK